MRRSRKPRQAENGSQRRRRRWGPDELGEEDMGWRYAHAACFTRRLRMEISQPEYTAEAAVGEFMAATDGKMSLREVYAREEQEEEEGLIGTSSKSKDGDAAAAAVKRLNLGGTTTGTVMEFLRRRFSGGGFGFRVEVSSMAEQRVREGKQRREMNLEKKKKGGIVFA